MSISNEALQKVSNAPALPPVVQASLQEANPRPRHLKLLREVETQAIVSQQQISVVRTQQASKQREMRMAHLTRTELNALPKDTHVYEGVGKMLAPHLNYPDSHQPLPILLQWLAKTQIQPRYELPR